MKTQATELLLRSGQREALGGYFRYQLDENPTWPDLWNVSGLLDVLDGRYERARNAFVVALGRNPNYATARWNLCWTDLLRKDAGEEEVDKKTGDVKSGLQPIGLLPILRNIVHHDIWPEEDWSPKDPSLGFVAVALAAARGDEKHFRRLIDHLIERQSGTLELFEVAELLTEGRPEMATFAELGLPENLNPAYAELFERTARMEAISGHETEALRLFALSALYRGNEAFFLVEKAEMETRQQRSEAALELLERAVEAKPDWYRAHLAIGYELSARGELERALGHLEIALRAQPGYADVQYQYSLLLHAAGRNEEAIASLKTALVTNPLFHAARIALANLLFDAGRPVEAVPHFEVIFEEGLESPSLVGRFGYAMHAAGLKNRAEETFLRAISQHRDRPEILLLYGMFLAETDRMLEARRVCERALDLDPAADVRQRVQDLIDGLTTGE